MPIELPSGPLNLDRVCVMGILNRTPDSFYDGGRYSRLDLAVARAKQMVAEGAALIDVGGEKAGPGAAVSAREEIERVIPVVEALLSEIDIPVSVDTLKPEVARAATAAGAEMLNSIGGMADPALRRVAAESGAAVVVMHIQGAPRVANPNPLYDNVVSAVCEFLSARAAQCVADGIAADRIVIDPGPDFGKTTVQSVAVLRNLDRLTALPYPVLLAVSRKKFIGELTSTEVDNRLYGSLAALAWGVLHGVSLVRVHDVQASYRLIRMTEAVVHQDFATP